MNSKVISGLVGLALTGSVLGQSLTYENPGFFMAPPQIPPNIDAVNFINDGQFIINFTNAVWLLPPYVPPVPYEMQDLMNFTNNYGAFISCNSGMRVNNYDPTIGVRRAAGNFVNEGTINIGTVDTTNTLSFEALQGFLGVAFGGSLASRFNIDSTNIFNQGNINMGFESLMTMAGNVIDMDYGGISMETNGFTIDGSTPFFNGLVADNYWGLGTNVISPYFYFNLIPPITPYHIITNRNYSINLNHRLGGSNFVAYLDVVPDDGTSNAWTRAAFISNTNAGVQANVYFALWNANNGPTFVEFTNTAGTSPNNLYVGDAFGFYTNYLVVIDGYSGSPTRPTYIPWNYFIQSIQPDLARAAFLLGTPATPTVIPFGTFNQNTITNQNSSYQGLLQPNSVVIGDNFGQTYSNSPGRIEIVATNYMSLFQSRISSLNFLRLQATNQFGGSQGAVISSPYSDFALRSTNGFLQITNLTVPTLTRDEGRCSLYSARWTNVEVSAVSGNIVTNHYYVLFVDAQLSPYSPTRIVNLKLTCTNALGGPDNLIISDMMNVISNSFVLDCTRLTITCNTNDPTSPDPYGGFNFTDPNILWSGSTPRLQYFTNNGIITAPNTVFFRGSRGSPYYSSNFNEAYYSFENTGQVTDYGSQIYATNFLNTGTFASTYGSIDLHQCLGALMTNGSFVATGGAGGITIESASLFASNHILQANAALTLSITNYLDDGSLLPNSADNITNKNNWFAGYGVNLLYPTPNASLLGTTISNTAQANRLVVSQWAAADRGAAASGFANNAAVGRLILDGANGCTYEFRPATGVNAMYVDLLDLRDFVATNVDRFGNFLSITCDPGMKVYFGQALANGTSIAEKLPKVNSGRFVWVSSFNTGFYSSTNLVYPDGSTNRLNTALVTACDIDSNGNGIPNCMDPAPVPILTPTSLSLAVAITNQPSLAAMVSWQAFPYTTNYLYSSATPQGTNWQLVTNFIFSSPIPGRVTVTDLIKTNVPRFYRVRAGTP